MSSNQEGTNDLGSQDDFFPSDFNSGFGDSFNISDRSSSNVQGATRSLNSFISKDLKLSRGAKSSPLVGVTEEYFPEKVMKSSKKSSKKTSKAPSGRSLPQESSSGGGSCDDFLLQQPARNEGWEYTPSDRNREAPRNQNWDTFETPKSSQLSFGSAGLHAPPFETIYVDNSADDVSRMPDTIVHMASFHGEMLQSFLQQSGQNDKMAIQTAMAFESFLKYQSQENVKKSQIRESQTDDDEETRMEQMESLAIDDDTFAPNSSLENGSFIDQPVNDRKKNHDLDHGNDVPPPDTTVSRRQRNMVKSSYVRAGRPPSSEGIRHMIGSEESSVLCSRESANSRDGISGSSRGEGSRGPVSHNSHSSQGVLVGIYSRGLHQSDRLRPSLPQPHRPRYFEEQLSILPSPYRITISTLKRNWEQGGHGGFPDEWYLRFAKCSPGTPYDYKSAWKVMKNFDRRYLNLEIESMEIFLKSKIIFPCRGLKDRFGHCMFYMQANRFSPREAPVDSAIDNLIYVMNCMMEDEQMSSRGIGFIMNMSDCKMHHFSVSYFHRMMMAVQGRKVPTRVEMFLIVNQPSWFSKMWGPVVKPMLHKDFREKTQRITFNDLNKVMAPGFENFLPSEIDCGKGNSDLMVRDFIEGRKVIEANGF